MAFDIDDVREKLSEIEGQPLWRSLESLVETPTFRAWVQQEFPQGADELQNPLTRRQFLKLAAASLGLAGLTACVGQPPEHILPRVEEAPEEVVPGVPLFFATAHLLGGYAEGLLAESHEGRPTKVEGNPDHPASLGATDAFAQASVLTLYDPDRSQTVTAPARGGRPGPIRTWNDFLRTLEQTLGAQRAKSGAGLRLLTPTVTSPTLAAQLRQVLEMYPEARWHQHEPVNWDNAYAGARLAFGRPVQPVYDFSQADVILSLDADFLSAFPGRLRYTRDFSARRDPSGDPPSMNRLYAVSGTPTLTTAMADHHWPLRPEHVGTFARLVAQRLDVDVPVSGTLPGEIEQAVGAVVRDLQNNGGRSLVLAGMAQPPIVHALAHAANLALGSVGQSVRFVEPVPAGEGATGQTASLRELTEAMQDGDVDVLLILGGNPAYTAPAGVDFADALADVGFSAHLSLYEDETSVLCDWHLPQTHTLESWGDARAYNGEATIIQPLVEPLYAGRSAHHLLAAVLQSDARASYDIVRAHWQEQSGLQPTQFDRFWRHALRDGLVPETARAPVDVTLSAELAFPPEHEADDALVALFRPDPGVWDGRFSNNAWLQELPRPFTKLTWDNAALVAPALAEEMGLSNGDVVRLRLEGRELSAPVWILPGQADGCLTLHLGYGRQRSGRVGDDVGFDAYRLRPAGAPWQAAGVQVERTGTTHPLASTQNHFAMEGRGLVRVGTLSTFREEPGFAHEGEGDHPSLYPEWEYDGYAWGMSIDLNACIGCNACVVACQAENNIPVVGREGVKDGREMHWIRVDGYFQGTDLDAPRMLHQPVPCMHCEKAPCEPVCPVAATTHSAEGLNEMTYNRCVGTRYCSNNCPYKVRRFNFFDYTQPDAPVQELLFNPDVTVRSRGVMEKCTYCVQRINAARSRAVQEDRAIRDGEIQTACQQACPAAAIVFGDISDPETAVARRRAQPRDYSLLAETGTRPRTTYLAKLMNPNEEIA